VRHWGSQITEELRAACETRATKSRAAEQVRLNVAWMAKHLSDEVTVAAARDLGLELGAKFRGGDRAVETLYLAHAKALDTKRSEPYWSIACELFARAGEQFVFYSLAEKGVYSDYLVHGVEEDRYLQHPLGNPYPQAADRLRVRQEFQSLMDDFRARMVPQLMDNTVQP
jgi:hypothetical protein